MPQIDCTNYIGVNPDPANLKSCEWPSVPEHTLRINKSRKIPILIKESVIAANTGQCR
jgi:hypothetical protein